MLKYIRKVLPTRRQRTWFWIVMLLLLSFYPYEIANAYYPFSTVGIGICFALCVLLTPILLFEPKRKLPSALLLCLSVMVSGCLLSFFISGDKYYYHRLIILYFAFSLIVIVYNKIGYKQFFILYNRWILIMALLGCVGFLISIAGVSPITSFIGKEDGREVYSWIITFTKDAPLGFIRYAGFFDEPGAMGYWGCFALAINRLLVKDERLEKILLVALVFTFSMGYIMQGIAYILMFSLSKSKIGDRIALVVIALILAVGIYSTKGTSNSYIYDESIGRIEEMFSANSDVMSFEGTTRESLVERARDSFKKNPVWGVGWPTDGSKEYLGDNYFETLAHDGIVGMIYQYFPYILLLFWAFNRRDRETVFVVLFLALAIFHRPIHTNILTYFIYYSLPLIYAIKVKEEDYAKRRQTRVQLPLV